MATSGSANAGHWRKRILQKVQSALISSLEIGDEKLQLVQSMQDVVENKSRQLEADCKALGKPLIQTVYLNKINLNFPFVEFSKDRESADSAKDNTNNSRESGSTAGNNSSSTAERTKRARRTRPDVGYQLFNIALWFILF